MSPIFPKPHQPGVSRESRLQTNSCFSGSDTHFGDSQPFLGSSHISWAVPWNVSCMFPKPVFRGARCCPFWLSLTAISANAAELQSASWVAAARGQAQLLSTKGVHFVPPPAIVGPEAASTRWRGQGVWAGVLAPRQVLPW